MAEKLWRTCRLTVNGTSRKLQYSQDTIDYLFLPFLRRLANLQHKEKRRILVYLAGPPGAGKSTLALWLEKLSLISEGLAPVQAVGIGGFRYPREYLESHFVERGGERLALIHFKEDPEAFDVGRLCGKLQEVTKRDVRWPIYDKALKDIVEEVTTIRKKILLIEGDWMLLREDGWQEVRRYCDYSLRIIADTKDIREGLAAWRVMGGTAQVKAPVVYDTQHQRNMKRALQNTWAAHETWRLLPDGDFQMQSDAPRPRPVLQRPTLWQQPNVKTNDVLLESVGRRMTVLNTENKGTAYAEGYSEGLSEARRSIVRRLFLSGSMTREQIMDTFHITGDELTRMLMREK
ncbi:MAG TPA: nucleoside/nucleotide kinase family protein [Selenomonas sp.]|nr:nucleoside/nucleotide kinase family protein [Selenomonadaceae bacterium]HCB92947.1 nucleoside/nucleotide kinase family protein [Selenomonas sp.]